MTALLLTIIGILIAAVGSYYCYKQYEHILKQKGKDIIVNVNPEIKIQSGIKITETKIENVEVDTLKMDDDYYTKFAVGLLRHSKNGDNIDIFETK